MFGEHTLRILETYWSAHFGCHPTQLFASPFGLLSHGGELAGYDGAFGLFRNGSATVSLPPETSAPIHAHLAPLACGCAPEDLAAALRAFATRMIGPAWIGYAIDIDPHSRPIRALGPDDLPFLNRLQQACAPEEWEHGGSSPEHPCVGVFGSSELIAVAGYETWGGTIAHISVVTHPAHRNQGAGRTAVAGVAQHALRAGLLPQYRTLQANLPSIRVAEALGFAAYATSMAVRF